MIHMKFTKMHGCGNDYIYVNCLQEKVKNPQKTAQFVSDRHFGIGSDGLILIEASERADFRMRMYNTDGSEGAMCGNGIRCVAKYVYDYHLTDQTEIRIETNAGIKYLSLKVKDDKVISVQVDMGMPILLAGEIPVVSQTDRVIDQKIEVLGKEYEMTCVSMGNPHAVVFVEDVAGLKLETIGPHFEHHERFPDRVNTEFAELIDRENVRMRVWERGSGETLACGTGACACVVAGVLTGRTAERIQVHLRGGVLTAFYDRERNTVFMEGPATVVFDGEIALPEF